MREVIEDILKRYCREILLIDTVEEEREIIGDFLKDTAWRNCRRNNRK